MVAVVVVVGGMPRMESEKRGEATGDSCSVMWGGGGGGGPLEAA